MGKLNFTNGGGLMLDFTLDVSSHWAKIPPLEITFI